jgi:hypothetical protein
VTVLVEVGPARIAQVSVAGELLGAATPYPGGLRVFTVTGREIGCASGYEAAGGLLALHAGYRGSRTVVRAARVSGADR